jgi:hypothetical protein
MRTAEAQGCACVSEKTEKLRVSAANRLDAPGPEAARVGVVPLVIHLLGPECALDETRESRLPERSSGSTSPRFSCQSRGSAASNDPGVGAAN